MFSGEEDDLSSGIAVDVFGLDERIAALSDGSSLWIVLGVAVLLGLRHAADPDHLAAVASLVASNREHAGRTAAKLGLFWGLGHATTLFAFGLPIVLFRQYLPGGVQRGSEVLVAVVIVVLALRLLYRWGTGYFHLHEHDHDGEAHAHVHSHAREMGHRHRHRTIRTPMGTFGIGLVHGMGGSAGLGVLLLASVGSEEVGIVALVLLAVFTAASMMLLSSGFGRALSARPLRLAFNAVAPVLGVASLAFGIWYGLGAFDLAPYYF